MQISRSEQKRRMKAVEQLVGALVKLPVQALDEVDGIEDIRPLFAETAALSGSVRQRQIKYLTKHLVERPLEPLYALVSQYQGKALADKKQHHTLEFYRDTLINEALERDEECQGEGKTLEEQWESATIEELQQEMPEIEPLTLSRLACLFVRTRNPRYSREIFRYLKSVQELRQRLS